jgi:uncharacterized membrane protein
MKDFDRDLVISYSLRTGVLLSISLIIIGVLTIFLRGGAEGYTLSQIASYHSTLDSSLIPLSRLPYGISHLDGVYFIALGLWVLIFTPVLVIFVGLTSFIIRKNWLYVGMSIFVLINIFFAMFIIPMIIP